MRTLFRAVIDRIKLLLASAAAGELEADAVAREAGRKAELLTLAAKYEAEGLHTVATGLRRRAEAISADAPAGSVLPALAHLTAEPPASPVALPVAGKRSKAR